MPGWIGAITWGAEEGRLAGSRRAVGGTSSPHLSLLTSHSSPHLTSPPANVLPAIVLFFRVSSTDVYLDPLFGTSTQPTRKTAPFPSPFAIICSLATILRICAITLALYSSYAITERSTIRRAVPPAVEVPSAPNCGRPTAIHPAQLSTGLPAWFMPAIWATIEFGHLPFVGERNILGETYSEEPLPSDYHGLAMHEPDRALQIVNHLHVTNHAFAIAYRDTDVSYLDGSYEYTPIGYDELCQQIIDNRVRYWFSRQRAANEPFQGMEEEPEPEDAQTAASSHTVLAPPPERTCVQCRIRVVVAGCEPFCVECRVDQVPILVEHETMRKQRCAHRVRHFRSQGCSICEECGLKPCYQGQALCQSCWSTECTLCHRRPGRRDRHGTPLCEPCASRGGRSSSGAGPSGVCVPVIVLDDDDEDDHGAAYDRTGAYYLSNGPEQPPQAASSSSSFSRVSSPNSPVTFPVHQPADNEPLPPSPDYSAVPSDDDALEQLNSAEFGTPPGTPFGVTHLHWLYVHCHHSNGVLDQVLSYQVDFSITTVADIALAVAHHLGVTPEYITLQLPEQTQPQDQPQTYYFIPSDQQWHTPLADLGIVDGSVTAAFVVGTTHAPAAFPPCALSNHRVASSALLMSLFSILTVLIFLLTGKSFPARAIHRHLPYPHYRLEGRLQFKAKHALSTHSPVTCAA